MFADDVRITTQNDAQTDLKQNVNFDFDGAVFNEDSNDLDFRVESDSNSYSFFVDASTDRVGMGVAAPSAPLEIIKTTPASDTMVSLRNNAYGSTDSSGETKIAFGWSNHFAANIAAYKQTTNRTGFKFYTELGYNTENLALTLDVDGNLFPEGGIYLGGKTATANRLDDYEEGTWIPTIFNATVTYTAQRGRYTKIGRVVYIHCFIQIASISGANSTNIVTGLPFTSKNDGNYPALASKTNGFDYGGSSTMCTFQVVPNATHIAGVGSGNNQSFRDLNSSGLSATDWIAFTGHYVTDS
jgi:hypothetical protein